MTDNVLRQSVPQAATTLRVIMRCIRCYIQMRNEQRELSGLSDHSLRDIGLTEYDVAMDVQRPVLRRCWQRAHSGPN